MAIGLVPWFDSVTSGLVRGAVVLLVLVNGAFVVGLLRTRSRAFVDRWTPRVVLTDAALAMALIGAPVANVAVGLVGKAAAFVVRTPAAAVTPDGK